MVPLLAGIALLAYFDAEGKPGAIGGQFLELLVGFVLILVGLVLAGPWLTTAASRIMTRRARRPATLIAGRRLLDNPKAAFRFISGLVIALFITSAVVGALSSIDALSGSGGGGAGQDTLADLFCSYSTSNCPAPTRVPSVPAPALAELRATPGVRAVTVIHQTPSQGPAADLLRRRHVRQLARTPAIGRCARGHVRWRTSATSSRTSSGTTRTPPRWSGRPRTCRRRGPRAFRLTPSSSRPTGRPGRSSGHGPLSSEPFPPRGRRSRSTRSTRRRRASLAMIQDMTDVIIVASLLIAACSLAVSIAAGLGERKRPFSLLRLTGVPLGVLRRVVSLESAVPLLLVAVVSIVVGLASAALYLRSQVGIAFQIPGSAYWVTVFAGLLGSLAIIASTFPLLNRITGPEVARNE